MSSLVHAISRRAFVMLPVLAPLSAWRKNRSVEHRFHSDHVIGTSLDLVVWTTPTAGYEKAARLAANAALDEIDRLAAILSTYDPASEISQLDRRECSVRSRELDEVFEYYRQWQQSTGGVLSMRPRGAGTPLNVDALGKAYILDRAAAAIRASTPDLDGLLLNIGGDIVVWGRECAVAVADPDHPDDNAGPLTHVVLRDGAVATSGCYARGPHLIDGRTGNPATTAVSATVVARDAVTANALATTLCLIGAEEGMHLVERTRGAAALRIGPDGDLRRTAGFGRVERSQTAQPAVATNWPAGYEVAISLTLTTPDPRLDRSFAAFWIEDPSGALVRTIVLWGNKTQYHSEMTAFWRITGGSKDLLYKVTRATRAPGAYKVTWNGVDDSGKPVPRGMYRVVVETNRYHGTYAKASGLIACDSEPASISLDGSVNFGRITIQYGPRSPQA